MKTTTAAFFAAIGFISMPFAQPASAETVAFVADLKAASEVPPTKSDGAGAADVTFDTATKKLTWAVNYTFLTGPVTVAHFHGPAAPGANAPVVVPMDNSATSIAGSATITEAQAADLMAGKWYINLHTAANKNGEIRGQVVKAK